MLPLEGLYFEILIFGPTTESITQPKPFIRDFCVFDIIVL